MRGRLMWLGAMCVLLIAGGYTWTHRHHEVRSIAVVAAKPAAETQAPSADEQESQQEVTITGPLIDYLSRHKPGDAEEPQPDSASPASSKTAGVDRVGDSPVGTTTPILYKTFAVARMASLPFDIPPYAANPRLRGIYCSFIKGNAVTDEADADVEFLLMNQQQYTDLLAGHPSEAVFSAEDAHNQEVNVNLPPTLDKPARYYLVFRNNSRDKARKLVQADFRVDF